jgi:hypothetical protein
MPTTRLGSIVGFNQNQCARTHGADYGNRTMSIGCNLSMHKTTKAMKKYEIAIVGIRGYELLFYWHSSYGIELIENIYDWQAKDAANRRVYEMPSKREFELIRTNKHKLNCYAA